MRSFRLLLAAACLTVLAGCSEANPGRPVAAGSSERPPTSTSTSDTSDPGTTSAPPTSSNRPKAIDMAAVDPCKLLRDVRPTDFGIDMATDGTGGNSSVFPGSKDCSASGVRSNMGLGLTAVVTEGFDSYTGSINPDKAAVTNGEVGGFRFAQVRPTRPESCFGVVDVNDGQMLYLVIGSYSDPPASQDTMCGLVPRITEVAMKVLGA